MTVEDVCLYISAFLIGYAVGELCEEYPWYYRCIIAMGIVQLLFFFNIM